MSAILPAFYIVLLFGTLLFGLVLIATGIVLLLKLKNKLAGGLTAAAGAALTIVPIMIFLALVVTQRIQG